MNPSNDIRVEWRWRERERERDGVKYIMSCWKCISCVTHLFYFDILEKYTNLLSCGDLDENFETKLIAILLDKSMQQPTKCKHNKRGTSCSRELCSLWNGKLFRHLGYVRLSNIFLGVFLNFLKKLASCFSLLLDLLREDKLTGCWQLTGRCQCYRTNGVRNGHYSQDGHETFKLSSQCVAQVDFSWVDANWHEVSFFFKFGSI